VEPEARGQRCGGGRRRSRHKPRDKKLKKAQNFDLKIASESPVNSIKTEEISITFKVGELISFSIEGKGNNSLRENNSEEES